MLERDPGPDSQLPRDSRLRVQRRLQLLAPYWRRLTAFAARKGAGHQAEDIASEAILLAAWSDSLDEGSPLRYLQRTVQNLAIDRHRKEIHRERTTRSTFPAGWQRGVDDQIADYDLVVRALQRLQVTEGPVTALLVWRRVVDEVPWSQLAFDVGMSTSSVQSRVRRAIQNLRPWLYRQVQTKDLA